MQTPKQVALRSQNRKAASVAVTGVTGPPETGEEGFKGTWGLMMMSSSYKRLQEEHKLLKWRVGDGFWCSLDTQNACVWWERGCKN